MALRSPRRRNLRPSGRRYHGGMAAIRSPEAQTTRPRSISDAIARAEARTKELGYKPAMDADFAADLEEIIRNRKPRERSAWR